FQEEGSEYLVAEQGAGDIARVIHEAGPVGAELEAHGDAGDDADGEAQRKDLHPELIGLVPVRVAGAGVAHAKVNQQPGEADGDGGEEYVETDIGGELRARQQHRVQIHGVSLQSVPAGVLSPSASAFLGQTI